MANLSANLPGHEGSFSNKLNEHDHSHNATDTMDPNEYLIPTLLPLNNTLCSRDQLIKHFSGICFIILYILLLVTFEVMIFICNDVLHLKILGGIQEPFALLILIHVVLWVITFVYDRYLHFHLHMLRKKGYLKLFTTTKELRGIPVMIFSLGNAALLMVVSFMASEQIQPYTLHLVRVFQLVASIEVAISLITNVIFLIQMTKFNREKKLPDVYNNDITSGFDVEKYNAPEVGFRDSDGLDDVLEKQSEMIQYLQQHNTNLSKRIIELTQLLPNDEQQLILNTSNINPNLYSQRVA